MYQEFFLMSYVHLRYPVIDFTLHIIQDKGRDIVPHGSYPCPSSVQYEYTISLMNTTDLLFCRHQRYKKYFSKMFDHIHDLKINKK